jgi:TPR repeat protein
LARIYRKGVTGEPDPVQAYFYAQRAIDAGMDEGYVIASELQMRGEGIAKDEPAARATLEKGAEAGLPRTTLALARLICKTADKGNACAETGARLNELYENEVPGAAEVLAAAIDERLVEAATPGFVKQLRDQLRIEFRRKALTNQITLID